MSHIDVTEATFERDVVEASRTKPVVVDFWAEWCGPCRALGPILERLADEADGAWSLAKLDVDSNQQIASVFSVQSIPMVLGFKDGRPVAKFVGALPEDQVRDWLAQLGPRPADLFFEEGTRAEGAGDAETARAAYERALQEDPGHIEAKSALARIDLQRRAGEVDADALEGLEGVDAAIARADLEAAAGDLENTFALLLDAVRSTAGDERERVRLHLLDLLDTIPADDPRAIATRRSLSMALF